jgi:hypothetical protein
VIAANVSTNMKKQSFVYANVIVWLGLTFPAAKAQLPPDFSAIAVTTCNSSKVSPGYLFAGTLSSTSNSGRYLMILNNDGTPVDGDKYVELQKTAIDFKLQPNGLISYAQSPATLWWPTPQNSGDRLSSLPRGSDDCWLTLESHPVSEAEIGRRNG